MLPIGCMWKVVTGQTNCIVQVSEQKVIQTMVAKQCESCGDIGQLGDDSFQDKYK